MNLWGTQDHALRKVNGQPYQIGGEVRPEAFRRFFAAHADEFAAADEFADAFPDDEPRIRGEGRGA
ncbi:hypothetical protein M2271_000124 [Streptomyces sp. LBL]|nr:hypothetical protein [Streptomyces sp. LBL]